MVVAEETATSFSLELSEEQAQTLREELKAISFTMPGVKSEARIILPKSEVDL